MTILLDLPNELLLSIFTYADPDDLVNFGVTCRHIFAVGEGPLREHRARLQKYHTVTCSDIEDECASWNLMYDVLLNPPVALYVRELELAAERKSEWETQEEWYAVAMEQSRNLDPAWRELVSYGNDGLVIECLLPRLLRLRELRYAPCGESSLFLDAAAKAARNYKEATLGSISLNSVPFQHLTTVSFAHWDTEGSMNYAWLLYFSRIPSVRSVKGHMVGYETYDLENQARLERDLLQSNATSLTMWYSAIGLNAFRALVMGMPKLRNFCYDHGGAIVDDYDFDAKAMFKILSKYTKDSLESLQIFDSSDIGYDDQETPHALLSKFKKLRTLDTDWDALLPDPDDDEDAALDDVELSQGFFEEVYSAPLVPEIARLLPSSLEELSLRKCGSDWFLVLKSLCEKKEEHCPKLRKLTFAITWEDDVGTQDAKVAELKEVAKKFELEVENCEENDFFQRGMLETLE
ncbi:uncharacterized protein BDZ99DRAFT_495165 [Mytilinidion resinicola]|uniref:F-box domain-containing protein n=1 Tax=Mytilinidion resinicola TaxID=574789 RepID=A0A6A6Z565_9PEZI|nr:uncharacterized protein BDZ99DRAFT_495165 [Mytilinidion resinicola]KAF2815397.1 hypothetical protein BDZ99DRAFT_495165 [Mytilinidion resinicola]